MAKNQQVKMTFGNISEAKLVHSWPNGRAFKHGAMKIKFGFHPNSFIAACDEVEVFMAERGYVRGKDYHIPAWNKVGKYSMSDQVRNEFYITFNDDETYVMAKMSWDLQDGHTFP